MAEKVIKCELNVKGMHCAACEILIEKNVSTLPGVSNVDARLNENKVVFDITEDTDISKLKAEINQAIGPQGYEVTSEVEHTAIDVPELILGAGIASVILIIFLVLQRLGIATIFSVTSLSLPTVFLIGVMASVSSCMAVVGSLVLTMSSHFAKGKRTMPLVVFHISRIISFFILGGVIGMIGSLFAINKYLILGIDVILFGVMMVLGLDLLNVVPFIRKYRPQVPKVFGKTAGKMSDSGTFITALLLGTLTFILPCGFTQSMQTYALQRANIVESALVMGVFALGTLPALAAVSFASVSFSKISQNGLFYKVSGFLIIFFAILNLAGVLGASGIRF